MNNKRNLAVGMMFFFLMLIVAPVFAESGDTTSSPTVTVAVEPTTSVNETTTNSETQPQTTVTTIQDGKLADAISKAYGTTVTANEVADLHTAGIGYGEISKAYGLAALSGKSVSEITDMKQTMGWGEIADSLGVKVSDITRNEKAVENAMKHENNVKSKGENKDTKDTKGNKGKSNSTSTSSGNSNSGGNSGGKGGSSGGNSGGGHGGGRK